ncbi:MAG: 30S ribosomal protein S20 [Gammaproteobacteria bacterium]|nr:30S ribosomal protein S20 [Gammaproteobacteria bacterium]
MANSVQARKRARQGEARRKHNQVLRSRMRTAMKLVQKAAADGDQATANEAFKAAVPTIDSMVSKGLLAKNTAARYKHRLNTRIKALSA